MGGIAVAIDWEAPIQQGAVEALFAAAPHRAPSGIRMACLDHAVLGEAVPNDMRADPAVATVGHLSLVGDLRLWNRDRLQARAGGAKATYATDDRHLLLEAYARTGIGFLDAVDGDFAFVIWNARDRTALAVRDRFGTKPLFLERTRTGIRFASEIKQLVKTSASTPEPCPTTVVEFLTEKYRAADLTFFRGIEKVRPSEYIAVDGRSSTSCRYWAPTFNERPDLAPEDIPRVFREHLVASVGHRLGTTDQGLLHVTGGLDSSSVTAAAAELVNTGTGTDPETVQTVSAVFPGHEVDESHWIDEIASMQPFAHHDFVPETETIDSIVATMGTVDGPVFNVITGMGPGTAEVAARTNSGLVLAGSGGDEVLDQDFIAADLLRSRAFSKWWNAVKDEGATYGALAPPLAWSLRLVLPSGFKQPIRKALNTMVPPQPSVLGPSLLEATSPPPQTLQAINAPSDTQREIVAAVWHPRRVLINEVQDVDYARRGIDISYPYLDREVVEFVTALTPVSRPFDGRSKTLVRQGFADRLPPSVLGRTTKTLANSYLSGVSERISADLANRFPAVSSAGAEFLNEVRYTEDLAAREHHPVRSSVWYSWMLMLWLEQLKTYSD